jgi:antitoxin component of RelBE/YafQ-DinJ toxin-antitoxin module
MNPIKMFLNSLKAKVISRRIDMMVEQKDSYKSIAMQSGNLLGLALSAVVEGTINCAAKNKEQTIDYYVKNEKAIKQVMEGTLQLLNEENMKLYKDNIESFIFEIKAAANAMDNVGNPIAESFQTMLKKVADQEIKNGEEILEMMEEEEEPVIQCDANSLTTKYTVFRTDIDTNDEEYTKMSEYLSEKFGALNRDFIVNRFNDETVEAVHIIVNNKTNHIDLKSQYTRA